MKKKRTRKSDELQPVPAEPESDAGAEAKIEDPIGDVTDGEAAVATESTSETEIESGTESEIESEDAEPEFTPEPRPPAKLERLQKILAQAGVASRRKAEEMIEQGRVQVNGKVVTVLGTKADAARDHIRVDGKLLHGSERLRYFVLNKPRGFVTTVKDPEGRPTVMQFFAKINERVYPVGRLDYMSEGLLLVTNDGELANRLTRAGSGIEKTYLVKVAGQPSEGELNLLRGGVTIERDSPGFPQTGLRLRGGGKPGSPQVRTAPARIRQVRQGDNPWYEVVLIEGRNRELRKMFSAVGHFVEKIRRVGYGPLVLDQEPGHLRELEPEELAALRAAAEDKLHTPKSKEIRRRNALDAQLPTLAPRPSRSRPARPVATKPFEKRFAAPEHSVGYRAQKSFGADRPSRPSAKEFGSARPAWKKQDRPSTSKPYADRPAAARSYGAKPYPGKPFGGKPSAGKTYGDRPAAARSYGAKPYRGKPYGDKPSAGKRYEDRPAAGRSYGVGQGRGSTPRTDSGYWPAPGAKRTFDGPPTRFKRTFRRDEGQSSFEPRGGKKAGWKPKPGSVFKSAYKGKPSSPRRTGAPGGKRRG
jgi:23S rRNA pseudouridine2605 synthase